MDPNLLEIEVKRAMAAQADWVVLLLDHAKFGKTSTSVMIHPRIITRDEKILNYSGVQTLW